MKRGVLFGLLILMGTALSSCFFLGPSVKGDGNVKSEERRLAPFTSVSVHSGMNVELLQGEEQKVKVVADANLHKLIDTRVEKGVLEIKALANIWKASEKKVVVTVNDLQEITGTAGSNINSGNRLKAENLKIRGSAGSNIRLELEGERSEVVASSGSNILLKGTLKMLEVKSSSGANIKAGDLLASECIVKASSGGNVWVAAQEELQADASSGGNIFYTGSPAQTNINSSSGGNIIKK